MTRKSLNLKENVVAINRVTKVVKGGKNMSFSALVVVGDAQARVVGFGVGKAKEVPSAIRKGIEAAKKNLRRVHLLDSTIPHQVLGKFGAGLVMLKPAREGTGVIAGGPVRAVVQACGIPNVLTKSIGSHNPHNVVKATINALEQLRDIKAVREMRGLDVSRLNAAKPEPAKAGKGKVYGRQDQNQADWQRHLHPGKAQGHRAQPGAEEIQSGGGAAGYAGFPWIRKKSAASAGAG